MLNISKARTPIYVQFYINTVLQRIVCIPVVNCLYMSMYTSSKCFLKAFENCKNHERLPTLHMLAAKKCKKNKRQRCKMGKTFNSTLHSNIELFVRIRIISTQVSTSSFHSYITLYHKLKLLTSID